MAGSYIFHDQFSNNSESLLQVAPAPKTKGTTKSRTRYWAKVKIGWYLVSELTGNAQA